MSETNPRESDLVLGGQNPRPVDAAILGGLAGIKQRLESESIAERLWALNNAVQYSENAIDLSIQALSDEAEEVRRLAKRLLRNRLGEAGKEALLDRDPMSYFTTFNDWHQEIYTPFIIDTTCLKKMIGSLCPYDMPKLEFFECFLNSGQNSEQNIETIIPILSGSAAPALKYLNLSNHSDNLIEVLAQNPISQNLAVLNIRIISLNMFAAEEISSLLNNYNNIKLLNIYFNGDTKNLSTHYMNKLQQLPFRVECPKQHYGERPIF